MKFLDKILHDAAAWYGGMVARFALAGVTVWIVSTAIPVTPSQQVKLMDATLSQLTGAVTTAFIFACLFVAIIVGDRK